MYVKTIPSQQCTTKIHIYSNLKQKYTLTALDNNNIRHLQWCARKLDIYNICVEQKTRYLQGCARKLDIYSGVHENLTFTMSVLNRELDIYRAVQEN